MSDKKVIIDIKNLKMHFPIEEGLIFKRKIGVIRAVDGVSFFVREGETLGLVGESGCGKSTTARTIAQLYQATDGIINFEGKDLSNLVHRELLKIRMDIQMIFQDPCGSLNPRMTAGDIIAEPLIIYNNRKLINLTKQEIKKRVEELMEKVGLSRHYINRFPHEFSGGQRQRIGVARALALNPKLILADEPVSALDVSIQAQILNLLKDLQEEFHLTYLFIAHDLAVVEYISDRIAVMYLGKIIEIANSKSLYKNPMHPYTKALLSAIPIPDPIIERERKRIILEGDVPSPDKERNCCYFYERCSKSIKGKCDKHIPKLKEIEEEHVVACFLYQD